MNHQLLDRRQASLNLYVPDIETRADPSPMCLPLPERASGLDFENFSDGLVLLVVLLVVHGGEAGVLTMCERAHDGTLQEGSPAYREASGGSAHSVCPLALHTADMATCAVHWRTRSSPIPKTVAPA